MNSLVTRAVGFRPAPGRAAAALSEVLVMMQSCGIAVVAAVHGADGAGEQRLIQAAGKQQAAAVRADIAEVERQVSAERDLGRQVPLLEPGDSVFGSGDAVGELRGGRARNVAERGSRETASEGGEVVARVSVREPLRKGRGGKQRRAGGVGAERRGLVEPAVAAAQHERARRAEGLPGEAEARSEGVERRAVFVEALWTGAR